MRGSRLLDRRPPHYRCPAVPGLNTPPGRSRWRSTPPFFPLDQLPAKRELHTSCTTGDTHTAWPLRAPLFDSQPRRPSCVFSGLEPHCRTSRCARPQPTPSPRYCSLTSLLVTAHCTYRYCSRRPLITAGHPVRSSVPSPVWQHPWLRNSTTAPTCTLCVLLPGSSSLPGPLSFWLQEKPYPRHHPMSTPAITDFPSPGAEVTCSKTRGRRPPPSDHRSPSGADGRQQDRWDLRRNDVRIGRVAMGYGHISRKRPAIPAYAAGCTR